LDPFRDDREALRIRVADLEDELAVIQNEMAGLRSRNDAKQREEMEIAQQRGEIDRLEREIRLVRFERLALLPGEGAEERRKTNRTNLHLGAGVAVVVVALLYVLMFWR
jgi:predicted RNase H-like nuclease (RuvC/YqgF family)